MAYVSVAEWRPEQVTEWLKGLDNSIISYIHWFSNNEINGQQLLNLSPDELTHLGVYKLGHQELILEAVQHLRNFHYELDRENLQLLALKLSCAAHSLYSEIRDQAESSSVPTQLMADVANVIHNVKPLVSWLDRPPFAGQIQYADFKSQLLSLSLEMATCAQRDRFAERPVAKIRTCSSKLAKLADSIIQDVTDPMILQPATLDLATIKKKAGEDLDFFLVPSFHGIHQIGDMKLSSPAHQSGKIQQGDEIVQVNYQTVVGWSRKKVLALFEESPNDLLITLKRRPRHVKMYGQIYMKPYRLPSRKRALPYSRWNDNLPSPRPELLTIPHFHITSRSVNLPKKTENNQHFSLEPSGTSSSSDEEFGQPSYSQSPVSMRLYLPKPRPPIQRRFTLSGPPRPSAQSEQFWRELQLERSWRSSQNNSHVNNSSVQIMGGKEGDIDEIFQLRDKSASLGNSIASASSRSTACVSFSKVRIGSVKFDLTKFDSSKNNSIVNDKYVGERKDKVSDMDFKVIGSQDIFSKNVVPEEGDSSKFIISNGNESLTISELNKLKRNAFFNNMECQNAQGDSAAKTEKEGSSEKVKRVIENFKMEISKTKKDMSEVDLKSPGKVMELIENFERVKNQEFNQTEKFLPSKKTHKERNRLDKSCSTPAYDTTESDSAEHEMDVVRYTQRCFDLQKMALELNQKNNSQFKNLANANKKNLYKNENCKKESKKCFRMETALEKNVSTEKEVFKSIKNISYQPEKHKSDLTCEVRSESSNSEDANFKSFHYSNSHSKEIKPINLPANSDSQSLLQPISPIKNEEFKPVPAQRKSKLPPKNNRNISPPCPLPPKPRSKPPSLSSEEISFINSQTPPEPPPRPEITFLKSNSKKNDLCNNIGSQEGDSRGDLTTDAPKTGALLKKSIIVISSPTSTSPGLQSFYDFKPHSGASTLGQKISKTLNASASGSPVAVPLVEKEKSRPSGSTLESLKAILTLGKKSGNINSPRSIRKKNAMLAKKRNVAVKEFTTFENSGFLGYRNRKGTAPASWTRYYFILQGSNFYGFKSKESHKADLFIHLPGFTCTLAEEVKSREHSFKIYHTGTVFYFAANSKEDLQQWLDSVNLAISFQDDKFLPEAVTYSQTDSDSSDSEHEPETCFPSPKMKKVLGSSPLPKPARSHQNLACDLKKTKLFMHSHDTQKRFGSLKKLGSQKNSAPCSVFSGVNDSSEVASLDRKYLRFLGKTSPTPVPTSRFRSYRRMQPPPAIPPKGKTKSKSKNVEINIETENTPVNVKDPSYLRKKPLHSSNPSLIHPDMADYRITQERLAEFRRLRNQNAVPDNTRLMTRDQLMQSRRDESFRANRIRPPELSGLITLEQFLLGQEEERLQSLRIRSRPINEITVWEQNDREEDRCKSYLQSKIKVYPGPNVSSQSPANRGKKLELNISSGKQAINTSEKLKNAAVYPSAQTAQSASTSSQEEESTMPFQIPQDQNDSKKYYLGELSKKSGCNRTNMEPPDYQGIEYPPTFEPETYTLQLMLKNRKKKDSEHKNK